ncbi:hypothetical protein ASPCAL03455 [Aspergillus calidoustus]|uniref:Uncharacterized protein n=1 Tax=Aspergillus calidoustus TaxID=454130 RepID=A0A0U5C3R7_ASPCI|nr:hypothetical protein ASPCAL03455 [Aspergillus calidoustus]
MSPEHGGLTSALPSLPTLRKLLPQNLTRRTLLLMLKGALPPTIVIAIYQTDAISDITLTVGYLSALISVLSQALTPRAKFLKIFLFDFLATCVSASLCCLAVFCAVRAREHTAHSRPDSASSNSTSGDGGDYNSSACAVSGIWLIVLIWVANGIRAWRPAELQDPMVAFSVFACVTVTRAGMFMSLSEGLGFVSRLLKGFLIGFAVAGGVSVFIYPVTSRGDVGRDVVKYVTGIEGVLRAEGEFVDGVEWEQGIPGGRGTVRSVREGAENPNLGAKLMRVNKLQSAITSLNALHGKLQSDLSYSKDEIAWGKLSASDLDRIGGLLRNLLLPLSGMAMLPDILDFIVEDEDGLSEMGEGPQEPVETHQVARLMRSKLLECEELVNGGLQHALLQLEMVNPKSLERRHKQGDDEATVPSLDPACADFALLFHQRLEGYKSSQSKDLPVALSECEKTSDAALEQQRVPANADIRQELFLILYMSQLQESLLTATADFMRFAHSKIADGTMKRNRLIYPKISLHKWLSISRKPDDKDQTPYTQNNAHEEYPDPEHLPPRNPWEKASTILRYISHLIRSEESIFGFRVAAASFCVGILAYLHQTQDFFIRQRCIWAMIVIVIGMSPTSGQTLLGFVTRIAATVVSLALSLMVWYIPDQKTAGVLVLLYLANVFEVSRSQSVKSVRIDVHSTISTSHNRSSSDPR